jgi:hypothetical protein
MVEFIFSKDTSVIFLISQILVTIIAFFLVGLSIRAWKNTKLKKIIYVAISFALFAVIHIFTYIDMAVFNLVSDDVRFLISSIFQIAIMLLFVVSIMIKK